MAGKHRQTRTLPKDVSHVHMKWKHIVVHDDATLVDLMNRGSDEVRAGGRWILDVPDIPGGQSGSGNDESGSGAGGDAGSKDGGASSGNGDEDSDSGSDSSSDSDSNSSGSSS